MTTADKEQVITIGPVVSLQDLRRDTVESYLRLPAWTRLQAACILAGLDPGYVSDRRTEIGLPRGEPIPRHAYLPGVVLPPIGDKQQLVELQTEVDVMVRYISDLLEQVPDLARSKLMTPKSFLEWAQRVGVPVSWRAFAKLPVLPAGPFAGASKGGYARLKTLPNRDEQIRIAYKVWKEPSKALPTNSKKAAEILKICTLKHGNEPGLSTVWGWFRRFQLGQVPDDMISKKSI